ncbi:unnamed protein product [Gemmata massiliana]|uniref:Uncharacterized protein n=1 Tax=Gemmata massiliana TaxID=1210884 RepID=A0A6P2DDL3_9BACT|nr:unnamed protein product [Gemmata massiliana]
MSTSSELMSGIRTYNGVERIVAIRSVNTDSVASCGLMPEKIAVVARVLLQLFASHGPFAQLALIALRSRMRFTRYAQPGFLNAIVSVPDSPTGTAPGPGRQPLGAHFLVRVDFQPLLNRLIVVGL